MKTLLVSLFVLVGVAFAAAAEAPPPVKKAEVPDITSAPMFSYLSSTTGNSVLNMECHGDVPFSELYCHFTKMMFTRPNEEEKRKSRVEAMVDLDDMTKQDMAGFTAFFSPDDIQKLEQRMTGATPEKREYLQDFIDVYHKVAAIRGKAKPQTAVPMPDAAKAGGCQVTLREFDAAFMYAGKNKWVSRTGPVGLCNTVRVRTLENSPEAPMLWKFTEERGSAITGDLCAGVQINKPVVFSGDNPHNLPLNCSYITTGFW